MISRNGYGKAVDWWSLGMLSSNNISSDNSGIINRSVMLCDDGGKTPF
jgi:hypothetical protein